MIINRRNKIDIMQKSADRDDYGSPTDVWTAYKSGVWSSKSPLLGNEYFTAMTNDTKVTVKFNMRYVAGVTDKMRIVHGTETYEILSLVNVQSLNRELLCYCKLVD